MQTVKQFSIGLICLFVLCWPLCLMMNVKYYEDTGGPSCPTGPVMNHRTECQLMSVLAYAHGYCSNMKEELWWAGFRQPDRLDYPLPRYILFKVMEEHYGGAK